MARLTALVCLVSSGLTSAQEPVVQVGYDGGFFVRSADGESELKIGGLFQVNGLFFESDHGHDSEFELRRIRLEFVGRFLDSYRFQLEPNFRDDGVELEEAWVGAEIFGGDALLRLGRMKAPFNLEEVRSRRHIDFARFSIINQFAPAEDHGVFLYGEAASGVVEYNFAAYNGTGESDTNSSKDFAARLMLHPFNDEESALANLQIGVAGTWGRQRQDVSGNGIDTESTIQVIEFAPGLQLDGTRWRLGGEVAWFHGPWMAQAEYMVVEQQMSLGAARNDIFFHGGYVNLSFVLTGESKSFAGVTPSSPFDPKQGTGSGAWILAARFAHLRSDSALKDLGFTTAGNFSRDIRNASLGLNWVLNEHVVIRNAWVHSFYSDPVLRGGRQRDEEGAFLIEVQLHF